MNSSVKSEHLRSGCDETHWWIAYAKHSAVDGTANRDQGFGGAQPIGYCLSKCNIAPNRTKPEITEPKDESRASATGDPLSLR